MIQYVPLFLKHISVAAFTAKKTWVLFFDVFPLLNEIQCDTY
jgi:hypothetical protein